MRVLQQAEDGFQPLFPEATAGGDFEPRFPEAVTARPFAALWADEAARGSSTPQSPQEIIAEAHRQAEQIIAEARERATEVAEEEITAAIAAARQEQLAAFAEASEALLQSLREEWQAHVAAFEREAAGLVVGIARRVLHERFADDEEAIVPVVREALRGVAEGDRVQVVIAPQHQAALHEAYQELAGVLKQDARLEIVTSDAAAPFGCVAYAEGHSVDARLENRLQAVEQAVTETVISHEAA